MSSLLLALINACAQNNWFEIILQEISVNRDKFTNGAILLMTFLKYVYKSHLSYSVFSKSYC